MKVEGRCHCGNISYDAEVDPAKVTICHCTDCQTLSGSAYRASVPAPAATFKLRGSPKTYVKTAVVTNNGPDDATDVRINDLPATPTILLKTIAELYSETWNPTAGEWENLTLLVPADGYDSEASVGIEDPRNGIFGRTLAQRPDAGDETGERTDLGARHFRQ